MDKLAFKKELAALLELHESKLDDELLLQTLVNWDSLAKISLLGILSDQFSLTLFPDILDEVQTLGELYEAISRSMPEPM
ncbi:MULTISPECIES: hypothetical protein [Serratia]|uniref:hypothetical protein n=1 Tax=Serratia TaxID=613 RepID=UPI000939EDD1|nr:MULTISPECIES: hypothetical protein [Serratia]OKP26579.1 hypothetical protein BSQ40_18705 [Serratia fonticola]